MERDLGKNLRMTEGSNGRSAEIRNEIGFIYNLKLVYKLKLHYYNLLEFIRNGTISTDWNIRQ